MFIINIISGGTEILGPIQAVLRDSNSPCNSKKVILVTGTAFFIRISVSSTHYL